MGILTVYETKSTLYTSGTRSVPGPSCSKIKDSHFNSFFILMGGEGGGMYFGTRRTWAKLFQEIIEQSCVYFSLTLYMTYLHICI
jgi:hypothetical protein